MRRSHILFLCGALVALLWPQAADAQPRRAVRAVRAPTRSVVFVGGYHYRPWFYDPWYAWGQHPYGWYPPYPYAGQYAASAVRLQVEPREAEVFVDGYYAGIVDDFDGIFQRLRLEPGEHEIQLFLDGHRSVTQKVYLQPDATFRIRHTMEPLAPGEPAPVRPVQPAAPAERRPEYDAFGRARPPAPAERPGRAETDFGSLAIRVQPAAAQVLIDGEPWQGPEGGARLVVELPEGEHRVEVTHSGYASYASTVRVRRGEVTTLNVSLVRE